MSEEAKDGWNEWSKHIIRELERLSNFAEKLNKEIQNTNLDVKELKVITNEIGGLRRGIESLKKELLDNNKGFDLEVKKIVDTISERNEDELKDLSNKLESLLIKISNLEKFQIKLTTIGSVIAFVFSVLLTILGFFSWGSIGK